MKTFCQKNLSNWNHLLIASTASLSTTVQGDVQNFGSVAFLKEEEYGVMFFRTRKSDLLWSYKMSELSDKIHSSCQCLTPGPLSHASQREPWDEQGSQAGDWFPSDIPLATDCHLSSQAHYLNSLMFCLGHHPPGEKHMSLHSLIVKPGVVVVLEGSGLDRAPVLEGLEPADQPGQLGIC